MEEIERYEQIKKSAAKSKRQTAGPRKCLLKFFKSNLLVLLMLLGVLLGGTMGIALNKMDPKLNNKQIFYLRFPGDLFIQLMKMLIIPIVVSSLVTTTAEMDIRSSGRIGLRALVYYFSTLVLASTLGMTLAITVRPGDRIGTETERRKTSTYSLTSTPVHAFMDLLRNMVPDNLIEVCFLSFKTVEEHPDSDGVVDGLLRHNISNISLAETFDNISGSTNADHDVYSDNVSLMITKVSGTNMIGLVVVSIVFGCCISAVGKEARPLLKFCSALQAVGFKMIAIVIWTSPVGIAFLIGAKLAQIDDLAKLFQDLALFTVTVIGGLLIHGLVTLPVIYFIFVRKNPYKVLQGMIPAVVFAFGSRSSYATLPLTIKCLQEKMRVDPRVVKLVASVGATINMDGSCLYYTLMPVFVAQINNIPLSAGDCVTICLLGVSVSVGVAGVPGVGPIYILMMLTAANLPTDDLSTLLTVDWLLGRSRTSVNVLGDGFGAGIIEHLSRRELRQIDIHLREKKTCESIPEELEDESAKLTKQTI